MTFGGINLDGNILELVFFATAFTLLVVAFLIGRRDQWIYRSNERETVEALSKARIEEQVRIDGLREEKEGILREGLRSQEAIERWTAFQRDHENLEAMRRELEEFEREESQRIDELERRRAEAAHSLREIQAKLDAYPPEVTAADSDWSKLVAERQETLDQLKHDVEEAQKEYNEALARCIQAAGEVAQLESRRERLDGEIRGAHQLLEKLKEDQIDRLKPYNERLLEEASQLQDQIANLQKELNKLREIQAKLDSYPPEVAGADNDWNQLVAERQETLDQLKHDVEEAQKEYNEALARCTQAAGEVAQLESRRERLDGEIKGAHQLLEALKEGQIDKLKPYNERLLEEADQLQSQIENMQDELTKLERAVDEAKQTQKAVETVGNASIEFPGDALSVAITKMPGSAIESSDNEKLSAFRIMPSCLLGYEHALEEKDEDDLLDEFEVALEKRKLNYPKQIIRAFHTALKVNDLSPLTVLSGLSGTGKSQLPRAYARFFGIHFLHVPVEPGWDSPQDLLGFYDFVAERYRPTDRARALGHFDRKFAMDIGIEDERNWDERMLIILLDEMNLARTEYYFSEFLSRLEMRGPRAKDEVDEDSRGDAQIAIDLPYAKNERPKHLYVPYNVLWVGTLNEDETTQALSDKVLDRANSIRFAPPEPDMLRDHSKAPERSIEAAEGHLPYERWFEWSGRQTTVAAGREQVDETLEQLAVLMKKSGRGFGYRIAQSISAYIERYPGQDWRVPMIDQINMRLLPKLAGTEMSDCQETLDQLKRLSEDELGDPMFASALELAATESEASQIFNWPGYTYTEAKV